MRQDVEKTGLNGITVRRRIRRTRFRRLPALDDGGWTFIETLVTIAIIMILTATVGFLAIRYLERAKTAAARSQLETFVLAITTYYLDCGTYPSAEQGLDALWQKPSGGAGVDGWSGPYLMKPVPDDPWGNAYEYSVPGESGLPFGIRCLGADGAPGGESTAADIVSWE